jgi:hypothetical protein
LTVCVPDWTKRFPFPVLTVTPFALVDNVSVPAPDPLVEDATTAPLAKVLATPLESVDPELESFALVDNVSVPAPGPVVEDTTTAPLAKVGLVGVPGPSLTS